MFRYVSFCFLFTQGLAVPNTGHRNLAVASSTDSVTVKAISTGNVEAAAITGVPASGVNCGIVGYSWDSEEITSALHQATICAAQEGCGDNRYPKAWVNSPPLKWSCATVKEFPLMINGEVYTSGPPPSARVFYSMKAIFTENPPGYSTDVVYCGVARHRPVGTGFTWCAGATVLPAEAIPMSAADL